MSVVDPAVLAERRARRAERGEESLRARTTAAEEALVAIEAKLAEADDERERLLKALQRTERALTGSQQETFAEQQVRLEVEEALAQARRDLDAAETRAAALEEELSEVHGRLQQREAEAEAETVLLQHELDRRLLVEEALRGQLADAVAGVGRTLEALRIAATPGRVPALVAAAPRQRAESGMASDLDRAAARLRAQRPPLVEDDEETPASAPQARPGVLRRIARRARHPRS